MSPCLGEGAEGSSSWPKAAGVSESPRWQLGGRAALQGLWLGPATPIARPWATTPWGARRQGHIREMEMLRGHWEAPGTSPAEAGPRPPGSCVRVAPLPDLAAVL